MIDVRKICQEAIAGVPASLKDDPTTWSDEPTRDDVRDALSQATYDNVASALAGAFGRESERIATLMDAACNEDGPLADLDGIWDTEVVNGRTRPVFQRVYEAGDWEGRVEELRSAIREAVVVTAKSAQRVVTDEQIDAMIELDPRLATIAKPIGEGPAAATLRDVQELSRLAYANARDKAGEADTAYTTQTEEEKALLLGDDYTPPAFLNRLPPPEPEQFDPAAGDEIVWDDDEPVELMITTVPFKSAVSVGADGSVAVEGSTPPPPTVDVWGDEPAPVKRGRGKRAGAAVPLLSGLLEAAGFADKDVARLLGIDKSTYSLARAGKRPWQGLRDEQATALRAEIRARADALAEALVALDTPEVRHPSTPS